jgi:hypothetical protein
VVAAARAVEMPSEPGGGEEQSRSSSLEYDMVWGLGFGVLRIWGLGFGIGIEV